MVSQDMYLGMCAFELAEVWGSWVGSVSGLRAPAASFSAPRNPWGGPGPSPIVTCQGTIPLSSSSVLSHGKWQVLTADPADTVTWKGWGWDLCKGVESRFCAARQNSLVDKEREQRAAGGYSMRPREQRRGSQGPSLKLQGMGSSWTKLKRMWQRERAGLVATGPPSEDSFPRWF